MIVKCRSSAIFNKTFNIKCRLYTTFIYYIYGHNNNFNNNHIMHYSFETKANKRLEQNIISEVRKKSQNIIPTPFTIDPNYVDKHITLKFTDNNKEQSFVSTAKQIKLGNYCVCMQSMGDVALLWYNKSPYSLLIVQYIISKLQLYGNYVEITEKDFISWSGVSRDSFYRGINALLRPACPRPCAGDNLSLLAATTRKSIYVVNHNFIFRGNYDEFITMYEKKFPYGCKLDEKGKVIIER